jgi:5-methylcytosine-specific restriction protein A
VNERLNFYSSARWRAMRAQHLRSEPLCRECRKSDRLVPAAVVDHIIPLARDGERLDDVNLQSLCLSCHSRKTNAEGGR